MRLPPPAAAPPHHQPAALASCSKSLSDERDRQEVLAEKDKTIRAQVPA